METDPITNTFQRLRPTCVKLSKQPTRLCIQELRESLEHVDSGHLVKLNEYVLFPLQLTLQRTALSNELKQDAVNCIAALLRKTKVEKLNVFNDLFSVLTILLSDKEPGKVASVSEELKLGVINCLDCLLECSGLVIRSVLYRPKFLPSLGHAVSLLLDVIENEKSRELKIAALKCLRRISFCDQYADSSNYNENSYSNDATNGLSDLDPNLDMYESEKQEMYHNIRDSASMTMASFLPGISMTLSRTISGDPSQGHVVLTMAINMWADIVAMVMSDSCVPKDDTGDDDDIMATISSLAKLQTSDSKVEKLSDTDKNQLPNDEMTKSRDLKVHRTKEWFRSTGAKLKVLIEKVTSTGACHTNWKVRLALVNFCEAVLLSCTEALPGCVSLLVNVLVGSLEDDYSQVCERSKAVLDKLSQDRDDNGRSSFNSILEENLHSQLTVLPRLMRTADDVNKLRTLNLLNGYMSLLNDKMSIILSSSSHLKRLSLAFVQVLELDVSDVGIVEERTPEKQESAVNPSDTQGKNPISVHTDEVQATQYPRYRFKHFTGDKIRAAISRSCQLLGFHGDLALLADHFLDLFHESRVHQKQAVIILNEIVVGFSSKKKKSETGDDEDEQSESFNELKCAVKLLLAAYTSQKTWNLPTSSSTTPSSDMTSKPGLLYQSLNSNILLTCLLLEGIGVFASCLGPTFDSFLIDNLYLILSKLGDSNANVSRSAYGTLVLVSQNCGYRSIEHLITHNADYLVNSIALDLKFVFVNEQAPHVLKVMIQYSNQDILMIIEDTLNDIFNVMDLYPDQLIYALMKVLHALAFSIQGWFSVEQEEHQKPHKEQQFTGEEGFSRRVTSFLQNYIKSKRIALGEVEDQDLEEEPKIETTDEVGDDDLNEPDEKPEAPLHVKYATQVLEKCIHFLSSSSSALRVLVLDTVYYGILALKPHENDLLPMVHRLWPPITNRLTDKDQVVIIKVINVITKMAECSGDFMKRRVIKDVLPRLLSFLDKQAEVSLKAGPVYTHSQTYKLQVASLDGLGRLCKQLDISEQHLNSVARVCSLYLSTRQPVGLQKAAVTAFEKFIKLDPDAMWLILNNVYCPRVPTPPHQMFVQVKLDGTKPECKEFASNVTFLLDKLQTGIH